MENGKDNLGFQNDDSGAQTTSENSTPSRKTLPKEGADNNVHLERKISLTSGAALIVGTMVGSGIFVSPQGILEKSGSVGMSLIIWTVCGISTLLGALCFAEIGTIIPQSGGEYIYFLETFAPKKDKEGSNGTVQTRGAWYQPLPAFIFSWTFILFTLPASFAIVCLTFAQYFQRAFNIECPDFISNKTADKLLASCCVLLVTFLNLQSVKFGSKVLVILSAAKIGSLLLIILGGTVELFQGQTEYLETGFDGTEWSVGRLSLAFYSGMWAYSGWNNLNLVTGELKNPSVNLPRGILIAIPMVTVCYVLVNVSYLTVMSKEELIASETVAVLFGGRVFGLAGQILMIIAVIVSTFGAAHGAAFSGARICQSTAKEGHMMDVLSYVHVTKLTPTTGAIFNAILALLMIIPSDIGSLINFFGFLAWIFFGIIMIALLFLRWTRPEAERPFKVFIGIPIAMLVLSLVLVFAPIIENPNLDFLYPIVFIFIGILFYVPFVHFKKVFPGTNFVSKYTQVIFNVVATSDEETKSTQ